MHDRQIILRAQHVRASAVQKIGARRILRPSMLGRLSKAALSSALMHGGARGGGAGNARAQARAHRHGTGTGSHIAAVIAGHLLAFPKLHDHHMSDPREHRPHAVVLVAQKDIGIARAEGVTSVG